MTTDPQQPVTAEQRIRVMQIMAVALCLGVVVFGLVAVALTLDREPRDGLLAYMGAGFAVVLTLVRFVVPAMAESQMVRALDPAAIAQAGESEIAEMLLPAYQMRMILELALLEGAAFFNVIAYMIETQVLSLAVAGGLLFIMLTSFPTRAKIEYWLEEQRRMAQWQTAADESHTGERGM